MPLKHTLLFILFSLAAVITTTATAAPSGGSSKQGVIVEVPDHAAAVLHEKREIEGEDGGPLPVLADDSVKWTVPTTEKRETEEAGDGPLPVLADDNVKWTVHTTEKREAEEDGPLPVVADDNVKWTVPTTEKREAEEDGPLPVVADDNVKWAVPTTEKREAEEDGPLPVVADDNVKWTVPTTTNKRARDRRRQLQPRSQVLAYKSLPPAPAFSTLCYPQLKDPNYATSSVILDCFATQYGPSDNVMTFETPKTACEDTVCLTVYLPDDKPPRNVSSPANPSSIPFSDFTTELSAAYTRLRGQCGDTSVNSDDSTNIALGVTTLKDGADIYAIRVDLWDITGDDHSKGGELWRCHNLILGHMDPPHVNIGA